MKKIKFPIISNDDDECERTFGVIKFVVLIFAVFMLIMAVLKLCHWICPLLAWCFYFWNVQQYHIGCFSHVIDEYDDHKRGYPHDGLYRMFQSWKVFAFMAVLAIIAVIVTP